MSLDGQQALALLMLVPLIGTLFMACAPSFDMISIRQIALCALTIMGILLGWCAHTISHTKQNLQLYFQIDLWLYKQAGTTFTLGKEEILLLATCCMCCFALAFLIKEDKQPEKQGALFIGTLFMMLHFTSVAILIRSWILSILAAHSCVLLFLYLVAHLGQHHRGKAILQAGISFIFIDMVGLITFLFPHLPYPVYWETALQISLIAPSCIRLGLPPFSPWLRLLFASNSPTLAILFVGFIMPLAAGLLLHTELTFPTEAHHTFFLKVIDIISFIGVILAASWSAKQKNLRDLSLGYSMLYGSLFISVFFKTGEHINKWLPFAFLSCAILPIIFCLFLDELSSNQSGKNFSPYRWQQLEFISTAFMMGIPGLGVGIALWQAMSLILSSSPVFAPLLYVGIWFVVFLIFCTTACLGLRLQTISAQDTSEPYRLKSSSVIGLLKLWLCLLGVLLWGVIIPFYV